MKFRLDLFPVSALLAMACAQAVAQESFATYKNRRFEYSVDYPTARLRPNGESDNGDGQVLSGANGEARLTVFARYADSAARSTCTAKSIASASNFRITYEVSRPGLTIASGLKDEKTVFYFKVIVSADRCGFFQLEYPEAMRGTFDPLVARMANSFKF